MENTSQSFNHKITSVLEHKNRVKTSPNILDKASRIFEKEIAHKYGYKIYNFIDVKGVRFVIAEKGEKLYLISLLVIQKKSLMEINEISVNKIREITKMVAEIGGYDEAASCPIII
jgi:hypothetical protein